MHKPAVKIQFRPHHFMCTLGFQGKGYSPEFVANFQVIADQLQQDENTLLEVVADTDSICTPCPHRRDLSCEFQQKILTLDNAHKEALELEYGAVLSWSEAKHRIKQQMSLEQFHKACESCSWKEWGVCEEALRGLLQSTGSLDTKKNKL